MQKMKWDILGRAEAAAPVTLEKIDTTLDSAWGAGAGAGVGAGAGAGLGAGLAAARTASESATTEQRSIASIDYAKKTK